MTRQEFAHQIAQYRLQSTRRLPIAYQEVEWLQGGSGQYIDSGVSIAADARYELSATVNNLIVDTRETAFIGALSGNAGAVECYYSSNQLRFFMPNVSSITTGSSITPEALYTQPHEYTAAFDDLQEYAELFVDGVSYGRSSYTAARTQRNGNITLITYRPTLYLFGGHFYGASIKVNNVPVRDFVPCYRVSDNVAGLYDLVNGVFYTNAGTGTFAVGPDVGKGSIKFDGGIKCYLPSVKFYGACAQDGTPTPETPVPIKCNDSKWTMTGGGGTVDLSLLPDGGLYGIGNVRDEWDAATGKGVRRFGIFDIGEGTWSYQASPGPIFYRRINGRKKGPTNILSNYYAVTTITSYTDMPNLSIRGDTENNFVYIKNTAYSDPVAFRQAMAGAKIIYELETPVPFTATPQPIIEQNGSNQLSQTDGDIDDTEAEATFVTHS